MANCVQCKQPILPNDKRASNLGGIGEMYHDRCWDDDLDFDECGDSLNECSWCGGEGWAESTDPLWDGADEVPCPACRGTGLRRHQSLF